MGGPPVPLRCQSRIRALSSATASRTSCSDRRPGSPAVRRSASRRNRSGVGSISSVGTPSRRSLSRSQIWVKSASWRCRIGLPVPGRLSKTPRRSASAICWSIQVGKLSCGGLRSVIYQKIYPPSRRPNPRGRRHGPAPSGLAAPPAGPPSYSGRVSDMDAVTMRILTTYDTITVVGASGAPAKAAHYVPAHMQRHGWRGGPGHGPRAAVPDQIGLVDVFRPSHRTPDVARQAVAAGATALWLQLGIASAEARDIAVGAGLLYVEDRCLIIEQRRLGLRAPTA